MRTPANPQEVSRRRLATPGVVVALAAAACLTPTVQADRIESREVSAATTARAEPRPASWQTRLDYSQVTPTVEIVLSSPGEMEETIGRGESRPRTPLQVGFRRQLPARYQGDLARSARWSVLSDGSRVASIGVQSPGAGRLRLALQAALPAGARIRFFGPGAEPRRYPPYQPRGLRANRRTSPGRRRRRVRRRPAADTVVAHRRRRHGGNRNRGPRRGRHVRRAAEGRTALPLSRRAKPEIPPAERYRPSAHRRHLPIGRCGLQGPP